MENIPFDEYIWKTFEDNSADDASSKSFEFYFKNQKVGKASVRVVKRAFAPCQEKRFFPENWFRGEVFDNSIDSCRFLKPFLDITQYDFTGHQHQGFGRLGLQKMFLLSRRLGCEGRIALTATNNAGLFYEKCGFNGINHQTNGGKFFNPTSISLKMLLSKPTSYAFAMKEIAFKATTMNDLYQMVRSFSLKGKE